MAQTLKDSVKNKMIQKKYAGLEKYFINPASDDSLSPYEIMEIAIELNDEDAIEYLLQFDAMRAIAKSDFFLRAVLQEKQAIAHKMMNANIDYDDNILGYTLQNEWFDMAKRMLNKPGLISSQQTGAKALRIAARHDQLAIVEVLLNIQHVKDALAFRDPNSVKGEEEQVNAFSTICAVISNKCSNVFKRLLLENSIQDLFGGQEVTKGIKQVVEKGHMSLINTLTFRNYLFYDKGSLFFIFSRAMDNKHYDIAKRLLDDFPNVVIRNKKNGEGALFSAVEHDQLGIFEMLPNSQYVKDYLISSSGSNRIFCKLFDLGRVGMIKRLLLDDSVIDTLGRERIQMMHRMIESGCISSLKRLSLGGLNDPHAILRLSKYSSMMTDNECYALSFCMWGSYKNLQAFVAKNPSNTEYPYQSNQELLQDNSRRIKNAIKNAHGIQKLCFAKEIPHLAPLIASYSGIFVPLKKYAPPGSQSSTHTNGLAQVSPS